MGYCGVVVDLWDSHVCYFGVVVLIWNSYVGYCGVVVGVWDSYVGLCLRLLSQSLGGKVDNLHFITISMLISVAFLSPTFDRHRNFFVFCSYVTINGLFILVIFA